MIPCNKKLHNIKIKVGPDCDYCNNEENLPHYFLRCQKVGGFLTYWFNWWGNLSGILIKDSQVIEECILFGFPSNSDQCRQLTSIFYM